MNPSLNLSRTDFLPVDDHAGCLAARAWLTGAVPGPAVVAIRADGVYDISQHAPTMASLLERDDAVQVVRGAPGEHVGSLQQLLAATAAGPSSAAAHLLAPCDLQVVKAAGVTFASSLLERVIEERAGGDLRKAEAIRSEVEKAIGTDLRAIEPGSPGAQELKSLLVRQGMWSQYLEVGIGPDAEVFTKVPVLSSVGTGAEIGIHPESAWNNPEPEVVLAVDSRGRIRGATLGNDVNLRDFEGRSALLLSKAKDNNASCAIGPFIRLLDDTFTLDDLRREDIELVVEGADGFVLRGASTMREISRDPLDLVQQTIGANHQYPDGFMLFLGTLFAPVQDRDAPGRGFTHHVGDVVTIRSDRLGTLRNRVNTSDRIAPWNFGVRALFASLAARGLVNGAL
ncbi:fumarylacetoacetate hydrolase family protein [Ramlibacter ginsenosidimutans]|uniref:Fumarylacetoacetate hydrolase family protein n=1 Tax=Ramlibacter ginsenosidimutans TaxID=502333 RepID=A0A934WN24_9BURK|nr:fumarylacetoacetate hydrolase family protein [Ramlibacter ginsenosidimutans]MBK6007098.1 fumarylacetoacetate hydrolase family protein [Ramlibacter ginsenosidimutans]